MRLESLKMGFTGEKANTGENWTVACRTKQLSLICKKLSEIKIMREEKADAINGKMMYQTQSLLFLKKNSSEEKLNKAEL